MKRIISILLVVLCLAGIGVLGYFLFRKNNIETIEVVGNMQTVYFVNQTTDVNFADSKLKVTYKDGTTKLFDLDNDLVKVKNFSTSVTNNGIMKIVYKSQTIDVKYSVIYNGLYYLSTLETAKVNGSIVDSSKSTYFAGLNSSGSDKTTAVEMIYFYNDGACDYYTRTNSSASWYVDDGHNDTTFKYTIVGDTIKVNLGTEKTYDIKANLSENGTLTLHNEVCEYFDEDYTDFLKSKTSRTFSYYEMKTDRVVNTVTVSGYSESSPLVFEVNETYETCGETINLKVVYKNDAFLNTVYVRYNNSMLASKQGFNTTFVHETSQVRGYYKSVPFTIYYKVIP